MPDETRDPSPPARARRQRLSRNPRHAVPSLYVPSPRESVLAAGLGASLLAVLGLVIAGAGGSANAERNHQPAPADVAHIAAAGETPQGLNGRGLVGASGVSTSTPVHATTATTPAVGAQFGAGSGAASSLASSGIPSTALAAYRQAAVAQNLATPTCRIAWPLLAAIGRVESNHGRFAGAVLHTDGLSSPPVIGIPLNGKGTAVIRDTDRGRLDGDATYDRAVGPMQFIPSTWVSWGVDADHDGVKNPFDIFDATAAAAAYLCAAGRDLATYQGQLTAILSYNHSMAYVNLVMGVERVYASTDRTIVVPTAPGSGATGPLHPPTLPPVDPGSPRGLPPASHPTPRSSHPATSSTRPTQPAPTTSPTSTAPTSCPAPSTTSTTSSPPGTTKPSTTPSCGSTTSPSGSTTTTTAPDTSPTAAQQRENTQDGGNTAAGAAAQGGTTEGGDTSPGGTTSAGPGS